LYLSGGAALCFNLNKKADVFNQITFAPGYEFPEGGSKQTISSELKSLSGIDLGLYFGPGANCNIGFGLQLFADLNYYYFPFSILSDADLFINK
jgi:hypothetical protein